MGSLESHISFVFSSPFTFFSRHGVESLLDVRGKGEQPGELFLAKAAMYAIGA